MKALVIVIGVEHNRLADMTQVHLAHDVLGLLSRLVQRRQKNGHQNSDDRDDDQKFNQGKTV